MGFFGVIQGLFFFFFSWWGEFLFSFRSSSSSSSPPGVGGLTDRSETLTSLSLDLSEVSMCFCWAAILSPFGAVVVTDMF